MLTITAELLLGTIRAGSPHDVVMTGSAPQPEWPPSPARLFSALVAADGTRGRCSVTTGTELGVLESLDPPRIHADPAVECTELTARYVVVDATSSSNVQNYPARTSREVRPGVKVSPRNPVVAYVWDADLDAEQLDGLRRRAARVGYLGCADSPARVTVSTSGPPEGLVEWRPSDAGGVALPVPYPGLVDALDVAYDAGARRALVPNRWVRYTPCGADAAPVAEKPTMIWLELGTPVPGRRALPLAVVLRDALLAHVDRAADGDPGRRAPWVLHGHGVPDGARPYQLARYLPLIDAGRRHADGAIRGAAVWLPPGTAPAAVEAVRAAVYSVRDLRAPGVRAAVSPRTDSSRVWTTSPKRWTGPARRWFSVTPAVVERGRRRGPSPDDVRDWFRHAGHPEPAGVVISPVPTRPGVPRLEGSEVHRPGRDRHPFFWLEVDFDRPVRGPLCVGRSRSLGLGLLAPVVQGGPG